MLLDTCIVIDYLRQKPGAITYLEDMNTVPGITTATVAELYAGVRGDKERELIGALVSSFEVYTLDAGIAREAGVILQKYKPAHGLDLIDAMIAATALTHSLGLATQNLKHFPMFPALKKPY